jgi:hypothetical protein
VPKKEHIDGHETRVVPIFPEIEPYLRQAFDDAADRSVHVLPPRFHNEGYAYAGVLRAVSRASVPTWPKLFVNMRASRETELMQEYPEHVVHAWIGNSKEVAADHYLMTTDADYERATSGSTDRTIYPAQNPAQSGADSERQEPSDQREKAAIPDNDEDRGLLDTPTGSPTQPRKAGASESAKATRHKTRHNAAAETADLAELVRVLASLTPEERSALLTLAQGLRAPAT